MGLFSLINTFLKLTRQAEGSEIITSGIDQKINFYRWICSVVKYFTGLEYNRCLDYWGFILTQPHLLYVQ
jgi:hypothetical protein